MNFCTIIAKNYVAHARVLARSLAEQHPDGRLWTLIIDDFSAYLDPAKEPFEVLTPDEVGCEPFTHMALRYSVLELSTAVKPWLLRYLMAQTEAPVTYLDPDIKVYGSLSRLDELAQRHGVVVIPHNTEPIPPDGRRPSQVDVMIAGVYNLGYISLAPGPEVNRMLDWWAERLRRDCRVDPVWGYFVDQRWFDLAPGFLSDLAIVRDLEYDVAYWNLHSRRLARQNGRYTVEGRPLAFFHFSGFDPAHPLVLSRHQNRIDVQEDPVLAALLGEYARDVMREGHAVSREWPYSYAALGDGTRLDDMLRSLYDDYADEHAGQVPSPFTLAGAQRFHQWLATSDEHGFPGINRVLARVYRDRSDLRKAFPNLAGSDKLGFLRWADEYGRHELPLLDTVMSSNGEGVLPSQSGSPPRGAVTARAKRTEPVEQAPWGVNVIPSLQADVEQEDLARRATMALDAAGITALPCQTAGRSEIAERDPIGDTAFGDAPFPVNLICVAPNELPELVVQATSELLAGRYSIGLWSWEVSRFPEAWCDRFSLLEEIWVPSEHVAGALAPVATVPVTVTRLPVRKPMGRAPRRSEAGVPAEAFVFLFSFDYRSRFARKNPLAVLDAFRRAFGPDEGAALVLATVHSDRDPVSERAVREAAAKHPDIHVLDRAAEASHVQELLMTSDCYVSLHRAEAFGLRMAEAMALGKPVIATGYSGNLEFMTKANSLLVDYELTPVGAGAEPYPPDALWAEPDLDHAAALMRRLFQDRELARNLGGVAAADISRTHSPRAAGEIMYRRLESIRATGLVTPCANAQRARSAALAALPLRIGQGPTPRPGITRLRHRVFRLLLRLMRPFTAYQQTVNQELVAALEELDSRIAELRREAVAERARLLAELRAHED